MNPSWQARERAIDAAQFQIDWDNRQARCPMGKQSVYWHEYQTKEYARPVVKIRFRNQDCADCVNRKQCVRSKKAARSLQIPGRELYEALEQTRGENYQVLRGETNTRKEPESKARFDRESGAELCGGQDTVV
jgi:hypothetical protein